MPKAIVTTTIRVPDALRDYALNAMRHGHQDVIFIVVGDKKTPEEARSLCRQLGGQFHYEFEFMGLDEQRHYLGQFPELRDHLPYDSIQRRNIGLLWAYERGCDPIITIDDDNHVGDDDFVGLHSIAGSEESIEAISSSSGWLNVCRFLEEERGQLFYHRGFPPGARNSRGERIESQESRGRIVVNAGLWLDDPDVDAVTRLACPVRVTGFPRGRSLALAPGTWSPFDSQNTALAREVLPAYFLSPRIGRYDDIWAGYVVSAIAHHLGHLITFGLPLVRQERNPHDYWRDVDNERYGMMLTDRFTSELRAVELTARSYREGFRELRQRLRQRFQEVRALSQAEHQFLMGFLDSMDVWVRTMERVDGRHRGGNN
jgi:hypothetical protein